MSKIDWVKIRDGIHSGQMTRYSVGVINKTAIGVVLADYERLMWRSTYEGYSYDFSDFDALSMILEEQRSFLLSSPLTSSMTASQYLNYVRDLRRDYP